MYVMLPAVHIIYSLTQKNRLLWTATLPNITLYNIVLTPQPYYITDEIARPKNDLLVRPTRKF